MGNYLEYQDYRGSVEYSSDDECLYGCVMGVSAIISYEGETIAELKSNFQTAVDDYLISCEDRGKQPDKPTYSEQETVIVPKVLYTKLVSVAREIKSLELV